MDNRFSKSKVSFHPFGERIKVVGGLSYDIRKTLTDNVLTVQQYAKESLDDDAPDDYEFEYGRYSTETNLDLLRARENTRRVISEQLQKKSQPGQPQPGQPQPGQPQPGQPQPGQPQPGQPQPGQPQPGQPQPGKE